MVDMLLSYEDTHYQLNHFDCVKLAIIMSGGKLFSKILPWAKAMSSLDSSTGKLKHGLLHDCVSYNQCKLLQLTFVVIWTGSR